jgi:HSP20 family protein
MATSLTSDSPLTDLSEIRERIDRAFDELITGSRKSHRLSIDVIEAKDRFLMRADVPGIEPDDVKIEIEDDTLTVSGEHEESKEEKKDNYVRRERHYGSFSRSMSVPKGIDADDIEATISDGVLEVSIPKPKSTQTQQNKVEIKPKAKAEG